MKLRLLCLLFFCGTLLKAQTVSCVWAHKPSSTVGNNQAQSIVSNNNGEIFVAGNYNSNITFGSNALSGSGAYITKYDTAGNVLSAFKAVGTNFITSLQLAADNSSNTYLIGKAFSPTIGATTITGDCFIAKFNSAGTALWSQSVASVGGNTYLYGITVDNSGNIFVTGSFTGSAMTIDTATLSNTNSSSLNNAFIAKFNSTGNLQWIRKPSGKSDGRAVDVDLTGNVYVAGTFIDSVRFGATKLTMSGQTNDIFLVKYDTNGNMIWVNRQGGQGPEDLFGMDVDPVNGIAITGQYAVTGSVGFVCGANTITSAAHDIFTAKFDLNGNGVWIKSAGGLNYDYGKDVAIDGLGNVYVIGYFESVFVLSGTTSVMNTAGGGAGGYNDVIVLKYDINGNEVYAGKVTGTLQDYGQSICSDGANNIYISGYSQSSTLTFGGVSLSLPGFDVMFIGKIKGATFTGISESSENISGLSVYPNPSSSNFNFSVVRDKIGMICIYNGIGECVVKQVVNANSASLDVSYLPAGFYFAEIFVENESSVVKLLKQ